MSPETILYIIIAAAAAFAAAVFMYGYKTKYQTKYRWIFGSLRFLVLFALLLLLINPKLTQESYTLQKPKLAIVLDNSASIEALNQQDNAFAVQQFMSQNAALTEKFDLSVYRFGDDLEQEDSLSFDDRNTNLASALSSLNDVLGEQIAPTLLVSDGNQTLGSDYEYEAAGYSNPIFPVILGDSTQYTDLKIQQLNTNRYAFLKNQFPVEALLVYDGDSSVNTQFQVRQGGSVVFSQSLDFSTQNNTEILSFTLPANRVGLQRYTAQLVPVSDEKNTSNNTKQFAVEVIDQATNVLLVSKLVHPDLGALKKAIETNEQRTATFMKPSEAVSRLNDFQLIVIYQPDRSYAQLLQAMETQKKNALIITGLQTNWNFLNTSQDWLLKEFTNQSESVGGALNRNYATFAVDDIGFGDFPPLLTQFGDLSIQVPHQVLLEQRINGFTTGSPMIATWEQNGQRNAIWDAEGLWKWRARSFLDQQSFMDFDNFVGKLVQYLASNKRRSRLEVNAETFYYNNNPIAISAQYFDKNFVFDSRASLSISVVEQETKQRTVFPLLLRNNYYEVDLNSLPAGTYEYVVTVRDEAVSRSGNFTILDFNVEQQFLNADVAKLQRLANQTGGTAYFPDQLDALEARLLNDERFVAIEKSQQKVVPLIDWKYLLGLIALALASEWFIRKYNGLI